MGAFIKKKTIYGNPSQIPAIAKQIRQASVADRYKVGIDKQEPFNKQ